MTVNFKLDDGTIVVLSSDSYDHPSYIDIYSVPDMESEAEHIIEGVDIKDLHAALSAFLTAQASSTPSHERT